MTGYDPRIPSDLQGRILRLEAGYRQCIEDLEGWASWAGDYCQEDVRKHQAILDDTYDARPSTDELLGACLLPKGTTTDHIIAELRRD